MAITEKHVSNGVCQKWLKRHSAPVAQTGLREFLEKKVWLAALNGIPKLELKKTELWGLFFWGEKNKKRNF